MDTARTADDFRRPEDLGVTDIVTGFASEGQEMIDQVRRFGEKDNLADRNAPSVV